MDNPKIRSNSPEEMVSAFMWLLIEHYNINKLFYDTKEEDISKPKCEL